MRGADVYRIASGLSYLHGTPDSLGRVLWQWTVDADAAATWPKAKALKIASEIRRCWRMRARVERVGMNHT